jgi:23S rRNA (pseudouridine1915-N3)-methyltransferase
VKLALVAVGKLKDSWLIDGCAEFEKRLRPYFSLTTTEVRDEKSLGAKLPERYEVWALDERGKQFSSLELAEEFRRRMNSGEQGIAFVIGAADGLPDEIKKRARVTWSLGKMTLPHRLARLVLLEQLYRVGSILAGSPYHRE